MLAQLTKHGPLTKPAPWMALAALENVGPQSGVPFVPVLSSHRIHAFVVSSFRSFSRNKSFGPLTPEASCGDSIGVSQSSMRCRASTLGQLVRSRLYRIASVGPSESRSPAHGRWRHRGHCGSPSLPRIGDKLSQVRGAIRRHWDVGHLGIYRREWRNVISRIERGGPVVEHTKGRSGYGTKLMQRSVSQLGGSIAYEWESDGMIVVMKMNAQQLAQ